MLFVPLPFFSAAVADKYQNFTQNTALIYHNKTTHFPYYLVIQSGAVRHAWNPPHRTAISSLRHLERSVSEALKIQA